MAEHRLIDAYLQRLRPLLRGDAEERDDIAAELHDHLLESVDRLCEQGLDAHDAELLALARLGEPELLSQAYGARRWTRPRLGALAAAACVVSAVTVLGATALHPLGNDGDLARRLGFQPRELQDPSTVEINGVPLPQGVTPSDDEARRLRARLAILDG